MYGNDLSSRSRTLNGGRWRLTRFCSRCSASTSRLGDDRLDRLDAVGHLPDALARVARAGLEVRADARTQRFRLADVEHLALRVRGRDRPRDAAARASAGSRCGLRPSGCQRTEALAVPRRARPLPRFAGLLHLVERRVGGRSRACSSARPRTWRSSRTPTSRSSRWTRPGSRASTRSGSRRPGRRARRRSARTTRSILGERDQRRAVHGLARRALALSLRLERDAADRPGPRRLRGVRGRRRDPLPARARLHHRQRAEPEPLLAAAVRARRRATPPRPRTSSCSRRPTTR